MSATGQFCLFGFSHTIFVHQDCEIDLLFANHNELYYYICLDDDDDDKR